MMQNSKESREENFLTRYNVPCKELRGMKEQILAVQRMQDFIENNKSEEISLSDLARASLFSPWYAPNWCDAWAHRSVCYSCHSFLPLGIKHFHSISLRCRSSIRQRFLCYLPFYCNLPPDFYNLPYPSWNNRAFCAIFFSGEGVRT